MKLKTLLFAGLFLLGIGGTLNAQILQIHNGSFEDWQNVGSSTEEPSHWSSNKTGGGQASSGPQTCFRETNNPYDGLYSVRIETKSITIIFITIIVNGSCTSGKIEAPSTSKSEGYTHTIKNDSIFGSTFNGRPDSIIGYYRYESVSSDYGKIGVFLHVGNYYDPETPVNGNHPDSTINKIASGTFFTPTNTVSSWKKFSIPLTYFDSRTPEYILISMTSSGNQTGGSSGSKLWVDGMKAFYNPILTTGTITTSPYYVSDLQAASISIPFTLTGTMNAGNVVTAQLSDATGSFAAPVTLGTLTTTASGTITGTIPAGTATGSGYRVRVVSSDYVLTAADNGSDLQIYLASNSVAPTALQTIEAGTNGTSISATEVGTALSREWKYSATSGGPYSSFTPAETGVTFTPAFATYGSRFVVCESNFPDGITVTSSEVQIDVVDNSVSPATTQNIDMTVAGTQIDVTENPAGSSREWLFTTTTGGPYTSFSPAETALSYIPLFNTPGTFYVVCQSVINGLPVTSDEVQIIVTDVTGIQTNNSDDVKVYFSENALVADMETSSLINAVLQLYNMNGQLVAEFDLQKNAVNRHEFNVPAGLYLYRIGTGEENISGKILKN
ncbi:MAG TPA: PCMD domain-containing protein [Bacteroidales bacterium]|nr:PCMD domain-containing protein [Bacteroidales bacterium]